MQVRSSAEPSRVLRETEIHRDVQETDGDKGLPGSDILLSSPYHVVEREIDVDCATVWDLFLSQTLMRRDKAKMGALNIVVVRRSVDTAWVVGYPAWFLRWTHIEGKGVIHVTGPFKLVDSQVITRKGEVIDKHGRIHTFYPAEGRTRLKIEFFRQPMSDKAATHWTEIKQRDILRREHDADILARRLAQKARH